MYGDYKNGAIGGGLSGTITTNTSGAVNTGGGWVSSILKPLSFQAPQNDALAAQLSQDNKTTFQTNAIIVVVLGAVFILGVVGLIYAIKK